jgi:hypothetical protein
MRTLQGYMAWEQNKGLEFRRVRIAYRFRSRTYPSSPNDLLNRNYGWFFCKTHAAELAERV